MATYQQVLHGMQAEAATTSTTPPRNPKVISAMKAPVETVEEMGEERSPAVVEVSHATVDPDGHVTATIDTCGYELSFSVDEIDSLVAIKVFDHHFRIRLGRHDCQRVIQVPLTGSLRQRLLIDGSTGQQLIGP